MVEHYAHYRESAEAFSRAWRESYHPARTIAMLTDTAVDPPRLRRHNGSGRVS
jgi:hypothetical protein